MKKKEFDKININIATINEINYITGLQQNKIKLTWQIVWPLLFINHKNE